MTLNKRRDPTPNPKTPKPHGMIYDLSLSKYKFVIKETRPSNPHSVNGKRTFFLEKIKLLRAKKIKLARSVTTIKMEHDMGNPMVGFIFT